MINPLQSAVVGTVVAHFSGPRMVKQVVVRVTKTQVFIAYSPTYEVAYRRSNGARVGDPSAWHDMVAVWAPEHDERLVVAAARRALEVGRAKLRDVDWSRLSAEQTEAVFAALRAAGVPI